MPMQRPLCSSSEGSWCLTPSGLVPGGEVLVCAAVRRSGGDGARPDLTFTSSSRVFNVKCLDLFVISLFLLVLCVIVDPPLK
jgi:hypothetical protein